MKIVNVKRFSKILLLLGGTALQAESSWKVSTGYDFSNGDFGSTQQTEITSVPLNISWKQGAWSLKSSVSYVELSAPESIIIADGVTNTTTETQIVTQQSGLSDTSFTVKYELDSDSSRGLFLDLSTKFKLPTGDEDKGLSSGELDMTFQIDAAWAKQQWMPFASIGYRVTGDSDSYQPDDVWLASVGGQYQLNASIALGGLFDYRQAYSSSSDDLQELMIYSSHKLGKDYRMTLYGVKGFSDSSIDNGAGISMSVRF